MLDETGVKIGVEAYPFGGRQNEVAPIAQKQDVIL
jgi:hypothetical protein